MERLNQRCVECWHAGKCDPGRDSELGIADAVPAEVFRTPVFIHCTARGADEFRCMPEFVDGCRGKGAIKPDRVAQAESGSAEHRPA